MIIFTPFLLLAIDSLGDYFLGVSLIFLFMRAYSAYLHRADTNLSTIAYIFYLPELVTGPFRPYSKWSRLTFSNVKTRFHLNKTFNACIVLLAAGLILSHTYQALDNPILKSLLVYVMLYIQFKSVTDIINEISYAIGLERIENFNKPWLAINISDFWSRWHISLGEFVKTHFNQPLTMFLCKKGINSKIAYYISIMFSFIFIGLWHDYSISYLFFGLYFGCVVCAERFLSKARLTRYLRSKRIIKIVYTQITHFIGFHLVSEIVFKILVKA